MALRKVGRSGQLAQQEESQIFPTTPTLTAAGGVGATAVDEVSFVEVAMLVLYLNVTAIDSATTLDFAIVEEVGGVDYPWPGTGFVQVTAVGKQRIEVAAPVSKNIKITATLGGANGKHAAFRMDAVVRYR